MGTLLGTSLCCVYKIPSFSCTYINKYQAILNHTYIILKLIITLFLKYSMYLYVYILKHHTANTGIVTIVIIHLINSVNMFPKKLEMPNTQSLDFIGRVVT